MSRPVGSITALSGLLAVQALVGAPAIAGPADGLDTGETRPLAEFSVPGAERFVPGAVSLAAAPDGTMYAAGFFTGDIARFTLGDDVVRPGAGLEAVAPDVYGDHVDGKEPANDVAVGPDGSLYVAGSDTVRRITTDGTMTTLSTTGPSGIAVDAAGSVYVTNNHRLDKIDGTGASSVLVGANGASREPADGVPAVDAAFAPAILGDVAVSPAGVVYFSETGAKRAHVWRINPDGTLGTVVGGQPPGYAGDGGPATDARIAKAGELAVEGDHLYLVDAARLESGNNHLRAIDGTGTITTVGPAVADLTGVAVGPHGELYVATSTTVSVVSRDGAEQDPVASPTDPAVPRSPWADREPGTALTLDDTKTVGSGPIAVDRGGNLYYSARLEDRAVVRRVDVARGRNELAVAASARSLAVGPDGSVYAANGDLVVRGYPNGRVATIVGGGTDTIDGHRATTVAIRPTAVTVGQDGHLYVVAEKAGVARLDDDGTLTLVVDAAKHPDIRSTDGIAVAGDGTVYLTDRVGNRVHRFTPDGKPAGADEVTRPSHITITEDGTRYVARANGITEFSADGTQRSVYDGPVAELAADAHGNLFFLKHANMSTQPMTILVRPGDVDSTSFPWTWVWVGVAVVVLAAGLVIIRRRRTRVMDTPDPSDGHAGSG